MWRADQESLFILLLDYSWFWEKVKNEILHFNDHLQGILKNSAICEHILS